MPIIETQNIVFSRYLDTNGDGSGTKNAIGDYSAGGEIFFIQPPPGQVYQIAQLTVSFEDAIIEWEKYGGIAALTNGIIVGICDDSGMINSMTDGVPIKTTGGWASNTYDATISKILTGDDFASVRWTFSGVGQRLRLAGSKNERLEVRLYDDFTGLVAHYFHADGFFERSIT